MKVYWFRKYICINATQFGNSAIMSGNIQCHGKNPDKRYDKKITLSITSIDVDIFELLRTLASVASVSNFNLWIVFNEKK